MSEQEYGTPDKENPEWTSEEMRAARPFAEVFPDAAASLATNGVQRRHRGPQKAPTKRMVSLRLDVDVLERYRASGKGWQSRVNRILAEHAPRRRRVRKVAGVAR
jgi:uncharacterized protein (DUF4415 family)